MEKKGVGRSVKRTLALISVTLPRSMACSMRLAAVHEVIYEHCYKFRELHEVVVSTKKCSSLLVRSRTRTSVSAP